MSRRAKTLTNVELNQLLEAVQYNSLDPLRDYTIIALSFKGGLRVGEIAGLEWRDVLDASGKLSKFV
jgi:integrase